MDPDLAAILVTGVAVVIGFPIARAIANRIAGSTSGPQPASVSDDLTARLDRIEQMMEVTQLEVERIAEGQRFTTKLLTERATSKNEERAS